MRILDTTRRVMVKLGKAIAGPPPTSGFICGECERWRSCGLPPSKTCPVMLEQIAREDSRCVPVCPPRFLTIRRRRER